MHMRMYKIQPCWPHIVSIVHLLLDCSLLLFEMTVLQLLVYKDQFLSHLTLSAMWKAWSKCYQNCQTIHILVVLFYISQEQENICWIKMDRRWNSKTTDIYLHIFYCGRLQISCLHLNWSQLSFHGSWKLEWFLSVALTLYRYFESYRRQGNQWPFGNQETVLEVAQIKDHDPL